MVANIAHCHRCDRRELRDTTLVCLVNGKACRDNAKGECPLGLFEKPLDPAPLERKSKRSRFHTLWDALHHRPLEAPEPIDPATELEWIDREITPRLPCGECKRHWKRVLKRFPLVARTRIAYARQVWTWHNVVNVEKKDAAPILPWGEAAPRNGWDKL